MDFTAYNLLWVKKYKLIFSFFHLPDECVDLGSLDVIQLFHSSLDLRLVCPHVHDEDQSVVVFNLLHCWLSGQGMLDDGIVIKLVGPGCRFLGVLWVSCKTEGLGKMEMHWCAYLPLCSPPGALEHRLLSFLCLGGLRGLGRASLGLSYGSKAILLHQFQMIVLNFGFF